VTSCNQPDDETRPTRSLITKPKLENASITEPLQYRQHAEGKGKRRKGRKGLKGVTKKTGKMEGKRGREWKYKRIGRYKRVRGIGRRRGVKWLTKPN